MPIPNEYDLFTFILKVSSFIFILSIIVLIVKKGFKKYKRVVIILLILALVTFVGSKLVMNAKPVFYCPQGVGDCDNI